MGVGPEVNAPGGNPFELDVSPLRLPPMPAKVYRLASIHAAKMALDLFENVGRELAFCNHDIDEAEMLDEMAIWQIVRTPASRDVAV